VFVAAIWSFNGSKKRSGPIRKPYYSMLFTLSPMSIFAETITILSGVPYRPCCGRPTYWGIHRFASGSALFGILAEVGLWLQWLHSRPFSVASFVIFRLSSSEFDATSDKDTGYIVATAAARVYAGNVG
jgi:hypothetical protein